MRDLDLVQKRYDLARTDFKSFGVDTKKAMTVLDAMAVSLHCWQGDGISFKR